MRKLLAVLLSITTLLFVLASCKSDETTEAAGADTKPEQKVEIIEVSGTEDLIEKRSEVSKNIKEMSADMSIDFAMSAAGQELDVDVDAVLKYDLEDKLMYIGANAVAMDETVEIEMYMDMGENGASYMYIDESWVKTAFDEEELAMFEKAFNQEETNFDESEFMLNASYSKEEHDGKVCYKLTYDMDFDFEKILEQTGMSLEEVMGDDYDEMTASLMLMMFESMGSVPVTEHLDATTLYPVSMEMDMADMFEGLFASLVDMIIQMQYGEEISAADLGLTFTVDEAMVKIDNISFENVTITIPEEALAAEEV